MTSMAGKLHIKYFAKAQSTFSRDLNSFAKIRKLYQIVDHDSLLSLLIPQL